MNKLNSVSFTPFLYILLIISLLFLVGWITEIPVPFIQSQELCLQYFAQGTLYGGQPYCVQGPVTYMVAYLLQFLPISFAHALQMFYLLSIIFTTYFVYKIKEAETKENSFVFIIFLCLFLFLKENDFATFVALPFLVLGTYYLIYRKRKVFGSILLGFALFSKIQTLFVIGPLILFYMVNVYQNFNKEVLVKDKIRKLGKETLIIVFPSVVILCISIILFDYFLQYYIIVHQIHPITTALKNVLIDVVTFKYAFGGMFLILYIGIFSVVIRIIENKFDVFSFIVGLSLPIFFVKVAVSFGITSVVTLYRYFLIFAPFYFILMYKLKAEFAAYKKQTKGFFFFGLLFLSIPLYQALGGLTLNDVSDGSLFNDQRIIMKIEKEVVAPLFYLNTTGKILVAKEYVTMFGTEYPFLYLEKEQFVNINPDIYDNYTNLRPDRSFAEQFVTLGIVSSLEEYEPAKRVNKTEIESELYNHTYQIILLRPYNDFLTYILSFNTNFIEQEYCAGSIPFLVGPYFPNNINYESIYFLNKEDCKRFGKEVVTPYYQKKFPLFCHRAKLLADEVKEVAEKNKIIINQDCNSLTKTALFITPVQIQGAYIAFFIFLFLWSCFFVVIKKTKNTL